jgi:hypothetical protein
LIGEIYERPKFGENKNCSFWDSILGVPRKSNIWMESSQKAYNGGEWCLLPKVAGHVKLVLKVVFIKFIAPFPFDLHIIALFSWLYKLISF